MGIRQNKINSNLAEIKELKQQASRVEASYGTAPRYERLKHQALQPIETRLAQLERENLQIEHSHEFAIEQQDAALAEERRQERDLAARLDARAKQERADYMKFDAEIASYNWQASGLGDKPLVRGSQVFVSETHRQIARQYAAERSRRVALHAEAAQEVARWNTDSGKEVIERTAAEQGISLDTLRTALITRAGGAELPALRFELKTRHDGVHYRIWSDDQGVVVERDTHANLAAALGTSNGGDGGGE